MMPRQYAAAMYAARTSADTAKVLNSVPRHLRALVIKHLVNIGNNRKFFHAAKLTAKRDRLAREASPFGSQSVSLPCVAKSDMPEAFPVAVLVTPPLSPMGGTFQC